MFNVPGFAGSSALKCGNLMRLLSFKLIGRIIFTGHFNALKSNYTTTFDLASIALLWGYDCFLMASTL
jgi:hypothetical protein